MKVLSFGEILLRLASPGYTKLFQKDSLDATFVVEKRMLQYRWLTLAFSRSF